jgi:hypothetical protein
VRQRNDYSKKVSFFGGEHQTTFVRQKSTTVVRRDFLDVDSSFHYVKQVIIKKISRPIFIFDASSRAL